MLPILPVLTFSGLPVDPENQPEKLSPRMAGPPFFPASYGRRALYTLSQEVAGRSSHQAADSEKNRLLRADIHRSPRRQTADISAALSAPGRAGEAQREAWPRRWNAALSVRQTAALGPTRESPPGTKNSQNQLANMQPMVCTNRGQYRLSWNIDCWLGALTKLAAHFAFRKPGP